jgi:hypothetical protein
MSLPKRLYELFRELLETELVKSRKATAENMLVFQNLLNQANPTSEAESAQHELVRGIYFSNPGSFAEYLRERRNRASALVLWTESKRIVKFFNLDGAVHISWDETEKTYRVVSYVSRDKRERDASKTERMLSGELLNVTSADVDAGVCYVDCGNTNGESKADTSTSTPNPNEVPLIPLQPQVGAQPYLNRRARRAAENAAKPKGVKSKRGLAAMKYTKETRPPRFATRTYVDQRGSYDDYADQREDDHQDRPPQHEYKQVLRRDTQQRGSYQQREPSRRTVTYQPKARPPRPPHPLRTISEVSNEDSTSKPSNTVAAGTSWADVAIDT